MGTIRSSERSVLARATWRHIPEDGILHSHRGENLQNNKAKAILSQVLEADTQVV
jgi:hypothetical protein